MHSTTGYFEVIQHHFYRTSRVAILELVDCTPQWPVLRGEFTWPELAQQLLEMLDREARHSAGWTAISSLDWGGGVGREWKTSGCLFVDGREARARGEGGVSFLVD
jgi:hypothetical protein